MKATVIDGNVEVTIELHGGPDGWPFCSDAIEVARKAMRAVYQSADDHFSSEFDVFVETD